MTEVRYPNTTMKVVSGTESTIITPQSLQAKETINDVTTTITPSSVVILDNDPSFPANMTILQDSINSSEVGTTKSIQIDKTGFYAKDESGHKNGVLEGYIYSTKPDGTYLNLDVDTGININGLAGVAGQVLQKSNPGNAMVWAGPPFQDTANNTLDMNYYGITNVANIDAISATDLNINGQTVFNTPPHIPDPVLGNDAASKGYVDTLIGNYSGNGLTLYFNYGTAQTDPIIAPSTGELQQTLAPINSPTLDNYYTMQSGADGTDVLIATFTTDVGYPNTLTIPTGLWSMLIWGYASSSNGNLYYHFHLYEVDSAGVSVALIATSGFSSDVNATSSLDPDAYHCSLALVAPYTMASVSNRLQIQIYTTGTSPTSTLLYTLFGGDYYSNVTTTLNGSTSLLTQNNTWTGVNNFTAGFLTGGVDSAVAGTLNLGTTNSTLTTIGSTIHPTAINAFNLQVNIAGNTGSVGQVLTSTGNPFAGVSFQNPAFVPTATQALNMATFGIVGSSMDSASLGTLSLGTTNATTTTLGRATQTTNINGATITLTGAVKSNNIDTALPGTLAIGGVTTNNIAIGYSGLDDASITADAIGLTATDINLTGNVKTSNIDTASTGPLSIGGANANSIGLGYSGLISAGITANTINLTGPVKTADIDSASSLNLGATTATDINIGSAGTTLTADIAGTTITLTGAVKTANIDSATTLSLGTTTATTTTLGRSGGTTAINGDTIGLTGTTSTTLTAPTINLTGAVKSNNIDTGSAGTLNIGNATTNDLTLGRAGLANARITANNITLTGAVGGITTLFTSGIATLNSIASATYNSTTTSTACAILTTNTAQVDILTATRTAATNMLTGTGANTFTLGSGTTGLSFVVNGLASTFNSATTSISTLRATTIDSATAGILSIGSNALTTGINFNNKVLSNITNGFNQYTTLNTANTSLPTSTQLGYYFQSSVSVNDTSNTPGTPKNLATYSGVPAGTWLFIVSFNVNQSGVDQATFSISATAATNDLYNTTGFSSKPAAGNAFQVTGVITIISATAPIYFVGTSTTANTSITNIRMSRTRIA